MRDVHLWSQFELLIRQNLACGINKTNPAQQAVTNGSAITNPSFPGFPHPLASKLRRPVSWEGNIIHSQPGPDISLLLVGMGAGACWIVYQHSAHGSVSYESTQLFNFK